MLAAGGYLLWTGAGRSGALGLGLALLALAGLLGLETLLLRARPQWGRLAAIAWLALGIWISVAGPRSLNALQTPAGAHFTGLTAQEPPPLRGTDSDDYTYVAKLRQGTEGHLLYTNRFTEESHAPVPLFSFYLLAGRLLGLLGIEPVSGFLLLTNLCALLPLGPLWLLSGRILPEPGWRSLALFSALFGLGWSSFSWLTVLIPAGTDPYWSAPPDLLVAEFSGFQLLATPHFAFALACMLALIALLAQAGGLGRRAIWLVPLTLALAVVHPFDYLQIALVSLVYLLSEMLIFRSLRPAEGLLLLLCGAAGLLPAALIRHLLSSVEVLKKTFLDSNQLVSPGPMALAIGFGSTALLLLTAFYLHGPGKLGWTPQLRLLWIWLLVGVALSYAPLAFQRRFLMALYLPAALLAVVYLRALLAHRAPVLRRVCAGIFVLSLLPSSLRLLHYKATRLSMAQSHDFAEMLAWINQQRVSDRLVFAQDWIGVTIPAFTANRAWVGHWSETIAYQDKRKMAALLWRLPPEQQARFLASCRAELFLVGPEDGLEASPAEALDLHLVHRSGPYRLYVRGSSDLLAS